MLILTEVEGDILLGHIIASILLSSMVTSGNFWFNSHPKEGSHFTIDKNLNTVDPSQTS